MVAVTPAERKTMLSQIRSSDAEELKKLLLTLDQKVLGPSDALEQSDPIAPLHKASLLRDLVACKDNLQVENFPTVTSVLSKASSFVDLFPQSGQPSSPKKIIQDRNIHDDLDALFNLTPFLLDSLRIPDCAVLSKSFDHLNPIFKKVRGADSFLSPSEFLDKLKNGQIEYEFLSEKQELCFKSKESVFGGESEVKVGLSNEGEQNWFQDNASDGQQFIDQFEQFVFDCDLQLKHNMQYRQYGKSSVWFEKALHKLETFKDSLKEGEISYSFEDPVLTFSQENTDNSIQFRMRPEYKDYRFPMHDLAQQIERIEFSSITKRFVVYFKNSNVVFDWEPLPDKPMQSTNGSYVEQDKPMESTGGSEISRLEKLVQEKIDAVKDCDPAKLIYSSEEAEEVKQTRRSMKPTKRRVHVLRKHLGNVVQMDSPEILRSEIVRIVDLIERGVLGTNVRKKLRRFCGDQRKRIEKDHHEEIQQAIKTALAQFDPKKEMSFQKKKGCFGWVKNWWRSKQEKKKIKQSAKAEVIAQHDPQGFLSACDQLLTNPEFARMQGKMKEFQQALKNLSACDDLSVLEEAAFKADDFSPEIGSRGSIEASLSSH